MNINSTINNAKQDSLKAINSLENLVVNAEKGIYAGKLYNKLIKSGAINAALDAINQYKKLSIDYNQKVDQTIDQKMEKIENDLMSFLIEKNNMKILKQRLFLIKF